MKKLLMVLAVSVTLLAASNAGATQMLQIKGSDTLINMVQKLAEVYMQKNPGKFIAVTGGGSGTGVAALVNKKCDIANSSRMMNSKEIKQASDNGVDVKRVVVAVDGLSVITNANNPISKLTVDEIGKIFRGEITNWSQVGGANMPITMYGRQSNSGTYGFFQEFVLNGDYSPKMNQMNGNAQIVEAVKQDASGIGYVGVGYVRNSSGITVLNVAKSKAGTYSSPLNKSEVESGVYPIARPLNQYINGTPTGDLLDFLKFEISDEGQKIVEEEGFFQIPAEYMTYNSKAGL